MRQNLETMDLQDHVEVRVFRLFSVLNTIATFSKMPHKIPSIAMLVGSGGGRCHA